MENGHMTQSEINKNRIIKLLKEKKKERRRRTYKYN